MKKRIATGFVISFALLASAVCFPQSGGSSSRGALDFYQAGKAAQDEGDWYSAAEQYQEALRLNPSFFDAHFSLAQCFYELDEYERALSCVLEAEALRANSADVLALHGFILIGLRQLSEAEAVFTQILRQWPNNIDARFGLGELDAAAGRISSAENRYMEALHRSPQNRKALLSLAMICQEEGKTVAAAGFINQALEYYGDGAQTLYIAGVFEANAGNYEMADRYLRSALEVDPEHAAALEVLSSVLYYSDRFREMNEIADRMIQINRKNPAAWYAKVLALSKMGRRDEAISTARLGLATGAEDEILRFFAEDLVLETLSLEDTARADWADARFSSAASFSRHHMADRALSEYRRGLKLNPYDTAARRNYASLLLSAGSYLQYLDEMRFVQSIGDTSTQVSDAVENYASLLRESINARWNIDTLYVDKTHIPIGVYYIDTASSLLYPGAEKTAALAFADELSSRGRFAATASPDFSGSYSDAFRASREGGEEFFVILSLEESKDEIAMTADIFLSRTGAAAGSFSVSRTGNGMFSSAIRHLAANTAAAFPVFGCILEREQNSVVIDLGKSDGLEAGASFLVIPDGALAFASEGMALSYPETAVSGRVEVSVVESDLSEGTFAREGFFDRMRPGDFVVLLPEEDSNAAESERQAISASSSAAQAGASPALFSILRSIR